MQVQKQARTHIRWCIRRDMPEVLAIEEERFPYCWGEEEFLRNLRQRNCIAMVAEQGERVIGYMVYELYKRRLHLLNMAVHKEMRRAGVGALMVRKLVGKLSSHRRRAVTVDVREGDLPAQLFLRAQGFKARKVVRGGFADTGEDAYCMAYVLDAKAAAADAPDEGPGREEERED